MAPAPVHGTATGWRAWRDRLLLQEDLNFLLTNRVPRIALSRAMGWLAGVRQPWVRDLSIALWKLATDLDLSEARDTRFATLRDCFIRELAPGRRPIEPDLDAIASPCDGIVGAHGRIEAGRVLQAKGMPYTLPELLGDAGEALACEGGTYVTLRLTSAMYHRFHAPDAGRLQGLRHIDGDTWNVNPIALKRVERLFCRNERAVLRLVRPDGGCLRLVAVAAVLVSGLRVHGVDGLLRAGGTTTVTEHPLDRTVQRGDELGWFEHGSTIVVLAPPGWTLDPSLATGHRLRMGQALLRRDGA